MMTKESVGALAMAAILILAGCSAAFPGGTDAPTNDDANAIDGESTQMTFYISDRPGAIDDFEHLNVTITKVGLHKAGADDGDEGEDANETESENDSEDESILADDDAQTTVEEPNETSVDMTTTEDDATETEEPEETETEEPEETETEEPEETESEDADADGEDDESESKAGWVEHDVDNQTVDLTKLQGANATAIANLSVPAGDYDKVFVYVSEINATLKNGETVNVKLPSQKLQIKKDFTVSANESPDFVFDINVHKAGNSGKYILRPIVSESGTGDQVEINEVDKNGKPADAGANGKNKGNGNGPGADDGDDGDNDSDDESESTLDASLDGDVRAGESVTLTVTDANGTVEGANVTVNGESVGETDADGTVTFDVPDSDELEVTVSTDDAELELEWDVKGSGNGANDVAAFQGYALA